jgi:ornithine carbamoyltransferase
MPRHFVDLWELSPDDACRLIAHSLELKRDDQQGKRPARLSGRTLGLLFEKPSLRTRVSFEAAISRLGGDAIFLRGEDVGLGIRESVADFARVLSQYVDAFAVRTFAHSTVEELARHATVPVINALSHAAHPCQAMADLMTINELRGPLEGRKLLFIGDGNNVAMSLAVASALLGVHFVLAAPKEYEFPVDFQTRFAARFPKVPLITERDAQKAVSGADVVYTDVWTSMGLEHEAEERRAAGQGGARRGLHALPAGPPRRGSDVGGSGRPAQPGAASVGQSRSSPDGALDVAHWWKARWSAVSSPGIEAEQKGSNSR